VRITINNAFACIVDIGQVFKLVHTDIVFGVLDRVVGQNFLNDFGRYVCHLWNDKGREICINFYQFLLQQPVLQILFGGGFFIDIYFIL